MNLDVIFTFIRNNGRGLEEQIETDARMNNKDALTSVMNALKEIRKQDIQNMTERGVHSDDFPDEQIGVEGYSIDDLIDYVDELVKRPVLTSEGGKRKTRKSHKLRKNKRSRKSRKMTKSRKSRKHSRKHR
jgi:hypothetical protein